MKTNNFFIFLIILCITNGNLIAKIIEVPKFISKIQLAINAASNGDTVLVEPGEYLENINFFAKRILVTSKYLLEDDTSLISKTIIKGDFISPTVTFNNYEDSLSVLYGFTIKNGRIGIYCHISNPSLKYLLIEENQSTDFGGGIKCVESNPLIIKSIIKNNIASFNGGGLYCSTSNPILDDVKIINNRAVFDGGGIALANNSSPTISNCAISYNIAEGDGGGIYIENSHGYLYNVEINNNKSLNWFGGGIHCLNSDPIVQNVLIVENVVTKSVGTGTGGGGISAIGSSNPFLSNVTIVKNTAIGAGGGIFVFDKSTITFDTLNLCNIHHNASTWGYEIYSDVNRINLVLDTFIVKKPNEIQLFPLKNFSMNILHGKASQANSKLYVSPDGDNFNDGISWDSPLKTIGYAQSIVNNTSNNQGIIFLDSGTYSLTSNGEHFNLSILKNITLKGKGVNETILDGKNTLEGLGILSFYYVKGDTLENLSISNGFAPLAGGIQVENSDITLKNVKINNCVGIYSGGLYTSLISTVTLINCLFYNNTASSFGGGAMYAGQSAWIKIINSTFSKNSSNNDSGGGIYLYGSNLYMINSIMWGNKPYNMFIYSSSSSELDIAYSNLQYGIESLSYGSNANVRWYTNTNIMLDPLFKDSLVDYHLTAQSPCIGSGINSFQTSNFILSALPYDIEEYPRIDSLHEQPDIGAYEFIYKQPDKIDHSGKEMVSNFSLLQNFPNPFNPTTTFEYTLASTSNVKIIVYNTLGQIVKELSNGTQGVGDYYIHFNGIDLPSGVYFYTINAVSENGKDIFRDTKKMLLMK